jgi:hypothetical protein
MTQEDGVQKKPVRRRRAVIAWIGGVLAVLVLYVGSHLVLSRLSPGKEWMSGGVVCFTFASEDPDTEHTLRMLYYPLVRIDEALGGRTHCFTVDYL